ncbi:MAG: PaaI family thioesterase [Candidatus Coprovivens sp.]
MDNIQIAKNVIEQQEGFMKHNNFVVEELTDKIAKMSCEITNNSLNPSKIAHGGLIFGLADSVMGLLAMTTGKNVLTINEQIDYIKAANCKKIIGVAEIIKLGKTISVLKCNIYNEKDELLSIVTGTYYFTSDIK